MSKWNWTAFRRGFWRGLADVARNRIYIFAAGIVVGFYFCHWRLG